MIMREQNSFVRFGAYSVIAGSVTMLLGALFMGIAGADLWSALEEKNMLGYLKKVSEVKALLIANMSLWSLGVLLLGIGGAIISDLNVVKNPFAKTASMCIRTGVALAIIAFIGMLSIVIQIAPNSSPYAVMIAEVVGWIGTNTDNVATALIIGAGPFFLSIAGYEEWVPKWLRNWGYFAGLVGLLSIAGTYLSSLAFANFLIIPSGMGWLISAGLVLLKKSKTA